MKHTTTNLILTAGVIALIGGAGKYGYEQLQKTNNTPKTEKVAHSTQKHSYNKETSNATVDSSDENSESSGSYDSMPATILKEFLDSPEFMYNLKSLYPQSDIELSIIKPVNDDDDTYLYQSGDGNDYWIIRVFCNDRMTIFGLNKDDNHVYNLNKDDNLRYTNTNTETTMTPEQLARN